jgi:hypothetical protein
MAKTQRQPFTPRGPFIVARLFRWGGRDFTPGEDFNATRMAVNQRRLKLLYDAKSIDVKTDYLPEPDQAEVTDDKKTDVGGTPEVNDDLVAGEGEFIFDTALHAVEKYEDEDWIADEAEFLVQISPNAAARLKEMTEGKAIVTALEILAWPETSENDPPPVEEKKADKKKGKA